MFCEFFSSSFYEEFVIAIGEFKFWHFEVGCKKKGGYRGLAVGGAPNMHKMSSLRHARQTQCGRWHVHGNSQDGLVLSRIHSLYFLAFIDVKHLVLVWANSLIANACVDLLCKLFFTLFMCLH